MRAFARANVCVRFKGKRSVIYYVKIALVLSNIQMLKLLSKATVYSFLVSFVVLKEDANDCVNNNLILLTRRCFHKDRNEEILKPINSFHD